MSVDDTRDVHEDDEWHLATQARIQALSSELGQLRSGVEALMHRSKGAMKQELSALLHGRAPKLSPVCTPKARRTWSDAAEEVRAKVVRSFVHQQNLAEMTFGEKTIGVLARLLSTWQGAPQDRHRSVLIVAGCAYEQEHTVWTLASRTGYPYKEIRRCLAILKKSIGDPHLRLECNEVHHWKLLDDCDVEMHGDYI